MTNVRIFLQFPSRQLPGINHSRVNQLLPNALYGFLDTARIMIPERGSDFTHIFAL
jgi:hypothetical protein